MWDFIVTIVLLTISGALAPGPLFFVTISQGARMGAKSGLIFSISHTLVEFTLVVLFALGLISVINIPIVRFVVGVVGGLFLLVFGTLQINSSLKYQSPRPNSNILNTKNLLLLGLTLTAFNPFFIVWWLTVGANLILLALDFASLYGVLFMYGCHVWMDYVWLTFVAYLAKKGIDSVGFKWYRIVIGLFGAILIYFGAVFLINSFGIA